MFHPPDRIELYLRKNFPQHVHGYRMGWLRIDKVDLTEKDEDFIVDKCFHLYTRENAYSEWELFGTVI